MSQRENDYTACEMTAARQSRGLIRNLGYSSPCTVVEMIVAGATINCPIRRAYNMYGPDVGALRGRSTLSPSIPFNHRDLPPGPVSIITLGVDTFVDGTAY